jgi:hypothetical protein
MARLLIRMKAQRKRGKPNFLQECDKASNQSDHGADEQNANNGCHVQGEKDTQEQDHDDHRDEQRGGGSQRDAAMNEPRAAVQQTQLLHHQRRPRLHHAQ